jgi:hypothetical protein
MATKNESEKQLKCIAINSGLQNVNLFEIGGFEMYFDENNKGYYRTEALAKLKKDFNDNNCTKVIEEYRQQELGKVVNKFSFLDKARIEEESKYLRNQRVFFGALILLGGVLIITMFSKKK